jgi:hypothetical protein
MAKKNRPKAATLGTAEDLLANDAADSAPVNRESKAPDMGGAAPLIDEPDNDPIARGVQAWERLKEAGRTSWDDWKIVGAALMLGHTYAMQAANNKTCGKRYTEKMHFFLLETGFDAIDKSDRGKLLKIMADLPRIEKWRERLTDGQRAAWNHPSTVWRISRCKDRGIEAVFEKAEKPIPDPKDLPPPTFEPDDEEYIWQRGLFERLKRVIDDLTLRDRWLLPEPPDRGLLARVDEVITQANKLREELQQAAALDLVLDHDEECQTQQLASETA